MPSDVPPQIVDAVVGIVNVVVVPSPPAEHGEVKGPLTKPPKTPPDRSQEPQLAKADDQEEYFEPQH